MTEIFLCWCGKMHKSQEVKWARWILYAKWLLFCTKMDGETQRHTIANRYTMGWMISVQSKGLSRVFSSITVQKHQFFGTQPSLWSSSHIHTWLLGKTIALTVWKSNQSILKEINPQYLLEGLLLKLKLQNIGHLMQRADSLEKTLILRKHEGRRRRGW